MLNWKLILEDETLLVGLLNNCFSDCGMVHLLPSPHRCSSTQWQQRASVTNTSLLILLLRNSERRNLHPHPHPFHYMYSIYHQVLNCGVRSSWEGNYHSIYFYSTLICTLWFWDQIHRGTKYQWKNGGGGERRVRRLLSFRTEVKRNESDNLFASKRNKDKCFATKLTTMPDETKRNKLGKRKCTEKLKENRDGMGKRREKRSLVDVLCFAKNSPQLNEQMWLWRELGINWTWSTWREAGHWAVETGQWAVEVADTE
jgi:hypothetical protein